MSTIKIKIVKARNLPVMDKASSLTDAYVEIKFGEDYQFKTQIIRKTLNPHFNQQFRLEITSDKYIQDNIIELKVWDKDLIRSSDDLIGSVYIDPNILISNPFVNNLEGWLPLFDSLSGIRGELYVVVKVHTMNNLNPFRESSSSIQFFSHGSQYLLQHQLNYEQEQNKKLQKMKLPNATNPTINFSSSLQENLESVASEATATNEDPLHSPQHNTISSNFEAKLKYNCMSLVEELLVEEDPEHDWIDSFRASRVSNEQRQQLLFKLSTKVRRLIGKKVDELGGHIVCGYQESFDLEDDNGIVVRAIGTMCKRQTIYVPQAHQTDDDDLSSESSEGTKSRDLSPLIVPMSSSVPIKPTTASQAIRMNPSSYAQELHEFQLFPNSSYSATTNSVAHSLDNPSLEMLESPRANNKQTASSAPFLPNDIQLLTMNSFEPRVVETLGAALNVRSVKLITDDMKTKDLIAQRDSWWREIREEIMSHAHSQNCTHVLGYNEQTMIYKDICILSASGTAAVLNNNNYHPKFHLDENFSKKKEKRMKSCHIFHVPASADNSASPFSMQLCECNVCHQGRVPEVVLSTLEVPREVHIQEHSKRMIEARICKYKKKKQGESNAKHVSDLLPFVDYEIHKQLLYKMKLYCLNCCFNIKYDMCISDTKIVVIATGTAFYATALPASPSLKFLRSLSIQDQTDKYHVLMQHKLQKLSEFHYEDKTKLFQRDNAVLIATTLPQQQQNSVEEDHPLNNNPSAQHQQLIHLDFDKQTKSGFIVEIDDDVDEDLMASLLDKQMPNGMLEMSNLQSYLFKNSLFRNLSSYVQTVLVQKQYTLNAATEFANQYLNEIFNEMYMLLAYRCQAFMPCLIGGIKNDVKLTNDSELLICLRGTIIMLPNSGMNCTSFEQSEEEQASKEKQVELYANYNIPTLLPLQKNVQPLPSQKLMNDILSAYQKSKQQQLQRNGQEESVINTTSKRTINKTPISATTDQLFSFEEQEMAATAEAAIVENDEEDTSSTGSSSSSDSETEDTEDLPHVQTMLKQKLHESDMLAEYDIDWMKKNNVFVTTCWYIPGAETVCILGRVCQHLVREAVDMQNDNGQLFVQVMLTEAVQVIKAHAAALNANCIFNLSVDYHVQNYRKQSYSLISISGDAAVIRFKNDDWPLNGMARLSKFSYSFDRIGPLFPHAKKQ